MAIQAELLLVEDTLWVLTHPVDLPVYDFAFSRYFSCRHPWQRPDEIQSVARVGAHQDYSELFEFCLADGVRLLHSPEEHRRCSALTGWYPLLADLTPRSDWFDRIPTADDVEERFDWPIFLKGDRQTLKHQRKYSVIENRTSFEAALAAYHADPNLRGQRLVCREFVPLRPVGEAYEEVLAPSYEFRTFWWRDALAGWGSYWWDGPVYRCTPGEKDAALALAAEAARRVNVPFLVVDVAQSLEGCWLVVECNDGQDCGYTGVQPLPLWQTILSLERSRSERSTP